MGFKEQILYELWGWDTFSSESYFCGRFETRAEAEAEVAREEEETWKHQSEGLRDSYWIQEITPSEIEAREQEKERRRAYEEKDRAYSRERLEENVAYLIEKLTVSLNQKIEKMRMPNGGEITIAPRSFNREVHMKLSNKGDCITFLGLGLRWAKKYGHCWLKYSWRINCETTRSFGCNCEKGTPYNSIEEFTQWISSDNAPKEIAQYIADSLQKEFWRS